MSYEIIEASVYDGDIVELYEFTIESTTYRFTSDALDYDYLGNTYEARPLDRGKVERTGELNRVKMQVTCDSENPIVRLFVITQPRNQIGVRIYSGHRADNDFKLVFSGRVLNCKWKSGREAELTCEPEMTSWRRQSLKYNYGKNCPYVVYSSRCRASRNPIGGTIRNIDGLTYYVQPNSSITAGRLIGGTISLGPSSRTMTSHTNGTYLSYSVVIVKLTAAIDGAAVGDNVVLVIGCNHSTTACKEWHNNIANFGGEPYTPEKNPFKGRIAN